MRKEEYSDARLIFEKYNGSHFQMERDGVYTEYKKMGVPKAIELSWLEDEKKELNDRMPFEQDEKKIASIFSRLAAIAKQTNDKKEMANLIKYAQKNLLKLDSFTNIMMAEAILNSISCFDNSYKQTVAKKALSLLRSMTEIKYKSSDSYKENGTLPEYITEDKIVERVQRNIKYWEAEVKLT